MTLLELIVVMGVIAVLMGLGIGFVRRGDGMPETRSMIAAELRTAALDARTRALPTEVLLAPGVAGQPAEVRARGLDPVVLITFEPGQQFAVGDLQPMLGGIEIENGRIGRARAQGVVADAAALPTGTAATPALRLPLGPTVADLRDGFALRLDVLLRERAAGRLLRLGRGLDVLLDDDGRLRARVQAGDDGRGSRIVQLEPAVPLPVLRWCTVEFGMDGHKTWLSVDGRELAAESLVQSLLQQKGDELEVLPGADALPAAVDELQVFAYAFTAGQRLPAGVELQAAARIAFDTEGEPIAPPEIKLQVVSDGRQEVLRIGRGGVLQ